MPKQLSIRVLETALIVAWLVSLAAIGVGLFVNRYIAAFMFILAIVVCMATWRAAKRRASELNRR